MKWQPDQTRILTLDEIQTVVADLKRKKRYINNRQNLVILRLSACVGLRASEIAGLTLDDIVLRPTKPYVRVRRAVAKGRKARKVPLWWDAGTLSDLTVWKSERSTAGAIGSDPFVASRTGRCLDRRNIRRRFINACKVLGRDEITVHDGRHTFVSISLAGGRSLAEVRDAAGHSNISTTSIYTHVLPDNGVVGDLFGVA